MTWSFCGLASFVLLVGSTTALAANFTLSDAGLMALDWHDPDVDGSVIARRDVAGPGVEFDIRFLSNQFPDGSIRFASTRYGGAGTLAGLDLSAFDNFVLSFTLLSINGTPSPGTNSALVVGALVYDSANGYRYRPEVIDTGVNFPRSTTSITTISKTARQDGLGFDGHMFVRDNWSPAGATITLLVQPAAGAVQIPEPATLALFALGITAACRPRRRMR